MNVRDFLANVLLCLEKHPCSGFEAGPSRINSARPISFMVFAFSTSSPAKCTSGFPKEQNHYLVIKIIINSMLSHFTKENITFDHGRNQNAFIFLQHFRSISFWPWNELSFCTIYIVLHPINNFSCVNVDLN